MQICYNSRMDERSKQKKPLSIKEIKEGCLLMGTEARFCVMNEEMRQGLEFIEQYPNSVTFFGSTRIGENDKHYKEARALAGELAKAGFCIVTGGGPGIMEAANRGAWEVGGQSIGLSIKLSVEQKTNQYITDQIEFYYFFNRKVALVFSAKAFLFFPGGFGTMDEIFEILNLVQTGKISKVPIIFFGRDFWKPLIENVLREKFLKEEKTIDEQDFSLFEVVDTVDEARNRIISLVKK